VRRAEGRLRRRGRLHQHPGQLLLPVPATARRNASERSMQR
jgi:hypothetical protein